MENWTVVACNFFRYAGEPPSEISPIMKQQFSKPVAACSKRHYGPIAEQRSDEKTVRQLTNYAHIYLH